MGLVLLGGLGLAARLPGLSQSLSYDELFTLTRFAGSPGAALTAQVAANNHPPASLLGWLGTQVAPLLPAAPEVTLRLPFALLGALVAPALVWAGRRAAGPRAAWLAGGLAALAPLAVDLSRQVRGYAPELVCAALLAGLVPAALAGRGRTAWPGLALVTALGVWAHPTLLLAVGAWLALAALARSGPALAGLCAGSAAGLLLLAPTLHRTARAAVHLLRPDDPAPRLTLSDLLGVAGGVPPDAALGDRTTPLLSVLLAGALLLLAGLGGRALVRAGRRREALALAAPLAAALLLPLSSAPAYPRFAAFALPSLLLLAGRGLAALAGPGRLRAAALLGGLLLPSALIVAAGAGVPLQELRGAARLARELAGPGGVVLGAGPGGELVPALDPAALEDPAWATTRTLLGGGSRQRVVLVVPLPPWTPDDVAASLSNLGTPVALAGRANVVLVWVVPPRE